MASNDPELQAKLRQLDSELHVRHRPFGTPALTLGPGGRNNAERVRDRSVDARVEGAANVSATPATKSAEP
jgi:hypothetical protein